jgi:hypothetical protein
LLFMSGSTPTDLAVAFRSLSRRLREAIGDANPAIVAGPVNELQHHVEAAAKTLKVPADAEAVATAIQSRPADDWDAATLDELRRHALDAGAALRRIAAAAEAAER